MTPGPPRVPLVGTAVNRTGERVHRFAGVWHRYGLPMGGEEGVEVTAVLTARAVIALARPSTPAEATEILGRFPEVTAWDVVDTLLAIHEKLAAAVMHAAYPGEWITLPTGATIDPEWNGVDGPCGTIGPDGVSTRYLGSAARAEWYERISHEDDD